MKTSLDTRLTQLRSEYEIECNQNHSAEFQKILELIISISVLFNRSMEKYQQRQRLDALKEQEKSSFDLANTHQGLGLNLNTGFMGMQALATIIAQPIGQVVGGVKGLLDESKQGKRTLLQFSSEKARMIADDLLRDAQKSQSLMNELSEVLKQAYNSESNAKSRMTGG